MALEIELMSGQETIKPLSTKNAVTEAGTLVKPREDVVIVGKGGEFLGDLEHTVHRVLAAKLVKKGLAEYRDDDDKRKAAEYAELEPKDESSKGKKKGKKADDLSDPD